MKIGIIGAGNVGLTMLECFRRQGHEISALHSRNWRKTKALGEKLQVKVTAAAAEAADVSDIILLTVPDRAIADLAGELVRQYNGWQGKFVYHLSGSQSCGSLAVLQAKGAHCGSFHPLQTFPSPEAAVDKLAGTYFAIDGDEQAVLTANKLVQSIGGIPLAIPPDKRALYHAAACTACNYFAALMHLTAAMLKDCGINEQSAMLAMRPIVEATWHNILKRGTAAALTGPIVRGDAVTVQKHISALQDTHTAELELYRALGSYTLHMAEQQPAFADAAAKAVAKALQTGRAGK